MKKTLIAVIVFVLFALSAFAQRGVKNPDNAALTAQIVQQLKQGETLDMLLYRHGGPGMGDDQIIAVVVADGQRYTLNFYRDTLMVQKRVNGTYALGDLSQFTGTLDGSVTSGMTWKRVRGNYREIGTFIRHPAESVSAGTIEGSWFEPIWQHELNQSLPAIANKVLGTPQVAGIQTDPACHQIVEAAPDYFVPRNLCPPGTVGPDETCTCRESGAKTEQISLK